MADEYIDLIDETGAPTGQRKLKSETHRDGDWHKSAHIWLLNSKDELLLQLRSPDKQSYPDMWDISAAGHLASGESPADAAVREAQEELGITISVSELVHLGPLRTEVGLNEGTFIEREINEIYLVRKDLPAEAFTLPDGEASAVRWMHFEEYAQAHDTDPIRYVPHPEELQLLLAHIRATGP